MRASKSPKLIHNKKTTFEEISHNYICGDKLLIGVTSLMKKHGLGADYTGIPEEVLQKAADEGTTIHKLLEDYDNGECVLDNDILAEYKKVMGQYRSVVASEYLVSDNEVVASKIDKVLADCSIIDIKTTSKIHTSALEWQLSIYAYLFELQNPGKKVPALYCLHYDKKKKAFAMYTVKRLSDKMVCELIQAERDGVIYTPIVENQLLQAIPDKDELAEFIATERKIADLQETIKRLTELQNSVREKMKEYMEDNGIDKMESAILKVTLRKGSVRTTIDSKRLKEEHPEIAAEYEKQTVVAPSIQITLK